MQNLKFSWLLLVSLALSGCASGIHSTAPSNPLDASAKWALMPIANNTDTPQAGLSAEAMVEHQLRRRGISHLQHYPLTLSRDSLFEPTERKVAQEALKWAAEQGVQLALMGSVEEWRYKVGIDGEPAVGVTLQVIDVASGQVIWSGASAKSGWSREALSAVAQSVMSELLGSLPLNTQSAP